MIGAVALTLTIIIVGVAVIIKPACWLVDWADRYKEANNRG